MKNCLGIINLDEKENKISELTKENVLASVQIGARYRVIDFTLSNMANAGIESIGIFTKNKSKSLISYLSNGRPWDLHRKSQGLQIFNFGDYSPEIDDVHSFMSNIDFFKHSQKDYVLLSPSYMISNIDYEKVLKNHIEWGNDITIIYKEDVEDKFLECNTLNLDKNSNVISIGENLMGSEKRNISMETYILSLNLFIEIIYECIRSGIYRKVSSFINNNLDLFQVKGWEFKGYLRCVNSIKSYYSTNLDFLNERINSELFNENNPIYTKAQDDCPTKYTKDSLVKNSIVANGTFINGKIENCIIGRKVYIGEGAQIKNSIIMNNTVIGNNVIMDRVIADVGTVIKDGESVRGIEGCPVTIKNRFENK